MVDAAKAMACTRYAPPCRAGGHLGPLACVLHRSIVPISRAAVSTYRGRPRQGEQPQGEQPMRRPCQGVSTRCDNMLLEAAALFPGVPMVATESTADTKPRSHRHGQLHGQFQEIIARAGLSSVVLPRNFACALSHMLTLRAARNFAAQPLMLRDLSTIALAT